MPRNKTNNPRFSFDLMLEIPCLKYSTVDKTSVADADPGRPKYISKEERKLVNFMAQETEGSPTNRSK